MDQTGFELGKLDMLGMLGKIAQERNLCLMPEIPSEFDMEKLKDLVYVDPQLAFETVVVLSEEVG